MTSTEAASPPSLEAGVTKQRFSLRWNDYKSSLISAFESLRSSEDLIDVTIGCEGQKFGAHKMLLSACSNYFRELLSSVPPGQHPIVIVREEGNKKV